MHKLLYALLALVALYLLTGVVQVRRGERAVVRRFGRVLDVAREPGLSIGLPWGMDRVDRVEVDTMRSVTVGYVEEGVGDTMPVGQLLTGDHNLVNVQVVVYYKVRLEEVAAYALQADAVRDILARAAEAVVAGWVASRTVDEVLLSGKTALRTELTAGVKGRIEGYGLGIDILDSRVSQIAPPDDVRDAFDSVSRAQTKIATLRNQAEQEADGRRSQARANRYQIEQDALASAHSTKVVAKQEAGRFLARLLQYERAKATNPKYLDQLWQEERGKLFSKLRDGGQIDLLDHRLGADGLDLWTAPRMPKK